MMKTKTSFSIKVDGGPRGSTHGRGEGGLTPFILLPCSLHISAPPLLAPRCAAKLSRVRRESSIRRPAPSSFIVPGGGREERRTGRRRTGQVGALSLFKSVFSILIGLSLHKSLKTIIVGEKTTIFLILFIILKIANWQSDCTNPEGVDRRSNEDVN